MRTQLKRALTILALTRAKAMGWAMFMACRQRRTAKYRRRGKSPKASASMYGTARAATCGSMCNRRRSGLKNQTAAEESQNIKKVRADAYRADGAGAVGKVADHDGVHDAHAHPADFGKDQRQCKADGGTKFVAKCLDADHVRAKG